MSTKNTPLIMLIEESADLLSPQKNGDAGYDIVATSEPKIVGVPYDEEYYKSITYIEYETNTRIIDPTNKLCTLILPRSSNSKYNLLLKNSVGLIDAGFNANILFRWAYTWQPEDLVVSRHGGLVGKVNYDKIYKVGDRIGQAIFHEQVHPLFKNEKLDSYKTDRGNGGFGSTNK